MSYSYKPVNIDKINIRLDFFHDCLNDIFYHMMCIHCKKIRRFYGKMHGILLSVHLSLLYGRILEEHFTNQDMVALCQYISRYFYTLP